MGRQFDNMAEAHSILGFHPSDSTKQEEIITSLLWPAFDGPLHIIWGAGRGHTPINEGKEGGRAIKINQLQNVKRHIQGISVGF